MYRYLFANGQGQVLHLLGNSTEQAIRMLASFLEKEYCPASDGGGGCEEFYTHRMGEYHIIKGPVLTLLASYSV